MSEPIVLPDGTVIPTPEEQDAMVASSIDAIDAERAAQIAQRESLVAPIVPPTVTGSTVAAVKASADAAIKAVAAETEQRLAALADVINTGT